MTSKYKVCQIAFDFEDDSFELPPNIQEELINDCLQRVWSCDEEDLVDEITEFYGFCVQNIDYEQRNSYIESQLSDDPSTLLKRESNLSE